MPEKHYELNFDGIPGPTHLFAGLAHGNIASELNEGLESNPKAAAKQSLEKIKFINSLGIKEAIIPPQIRPDFFLLKVMGYDGSRSEVLKQVLENDHKLFKSILSSSFMWTANAGTVSPSPDTLDGKLHITTANLKGNFHRSLESQNTYKYFRQVFATNDFKLHAPLHSLLLDEGAANHTRLCKDYGEPGLELFTYGYSAVKALETLPQKYPARQSLEASLEIINTHQLEEEKIILAQQNPEAIDAGVFHNDVISTGNKNLFLYHEKSFANQSQVIEELNEKYKKLNNKDLILLEVKDSEIPLAEIVSSYLFNSQIINPNNQEAMNLVCPLECKENPKVKKYIEEKIIQNPNIPIDKVHYLDLRESMRNGGGPACLRLRVVMSESQIKNTKQEIFYSDELYQKLNQWVDKFYPDKLNLELLLNEDFIDQLHQAYLELENTFKLKLGV